MAVDCVTSTLPNLEELYISGCWRVKNSSMALVASRLRKLKLIEVNSCRIGNDGLRQLSGLYIQEGPLDDESLPQLQHISVQSSTFVNHVGLLFVRTRMQHLTTLNIAMSISVQDRAVYEIAQMATLKHLDMHGCKNLTALSIWLLAMGSLSLTYLDVSYCPHIGDDAMEKVFDGPGLLALVTFKVASTPITDRGLTIVAVTMESLTSLDVSSCKAISKQGIEAASRHLENLRNFYLRFCKRVRNDALLPLSRMANLKVLNLKGCRQIGSRSMEFLASGEAASKLLELDVGFTSVDDFGLKCISEVATKLRVLGLAGCPVSDEGIALISINLPSLHTLKLSRCLRVTEKGIDVATCNHRNLTHIYVKGCPNITKAWKDKMAVKRQHLVLT
ncbi:F-box and leucine-rich repeat protein 13-like [Haemaphysalis longicornis]